MKYVQFRNKLFANRKVNILVVNIRNAATNALVHSLSIVPKDHLLPIHVHSQLVGYELSSLLKSETKGYLDNSEYKFELIVAEKCRRRDSNVGTYQVAAV